MIYLIGGSLDFILEQLIMALPAAGLSAHTAQALGARPVSAAIPNGFFFLRASLRGTKQSSIEKQAISMSKIATLSLAMTRGE